MRSPAACLFDLDGLLLDTEPLHSQAWLQASRHFGLILSEDQLLALRGRRRLDCAEQVRQWMAAVALEPPSVEALLAVRQPIAEALLPSARPMPGAQRLIDGLAEGAVPMALVTSSSRSAVALKAAPHAWLSQIALRVHGDDPEIQAGKPAADPYRLAARRLAVEPEHCWAFEDSLAGACSAAAAGCRVHVLRPAEAPLAEALLPQLPPGCVLLESLEQLDLALFGVGSEPKAQ